MQTQWQIKTISFYLDVFISSWLVMEVSFLVMLLWVLDLVSIILVRLKVLLVSGLLSMIAMG